MMQRRCFSTSTRLASYSNPRKKHWAEEIRHLNNVNRALTHFDDFYASVFGPQWPSLRIGLLSPLKYMAIPNAFTGGTEDIGARLEKMGAYNVRKLWTDYAAALGAEKKELDLNKDLGRLHQLERTLESIAATKKAEELDVLYQNAPTSKREDLRLSKGHAGRLISNTSEASGDFVPSTKLKGAEDFTFDSEYFESYLKRHEEKDSDDPDSEEYNNMEDDEHRDIQFVKSHEFPLEIPKLLVPYSFESGSPLHFPAAGRHSATELREYICINGASIVPVLALDIKPNVDLLDLCAGPGTKSLLCLMTMCLRSLTCNDLDAPRLVRIKRIMQEFTGTTSPADVSFTAFNGRHHPAKEEFSRVLADVPCLNDRVSCTVVENNIFKPNRTKERLNLVKVQREILLSGMRALNRNEGSALVYSTCTLSPIENDGVVMHALKETEVVDLYIDLIGLMKLLTPFERAGVFKISRTRCGVLIMPNAFNNFGPMYVSRLVVKPSAYSNVATSHSEVEDNH